jgi:hypothetical protein
MFVTRRLVPLFSSCLFAASVMSCTAEPTRITAAEATPAGVQANTPAKTEAEAPVALRKLTIDKPIATKDKEPRAPRATTFHATGKLGQGDGDVKGAPTFRLRQESGCARDVKVPSTVKGASFSFELGELELSEALACAVDASVNGELVASISISRPSVLKPCACRSSRRPP